MPGKLFIHPNSSFRNFLKLAESNSANIAANTPIRPATAAANQQTVFHILFLLVSFFITFTGGGGTGILL